MNRKYLLKALTLLACLLCSLGAAAAEAYACYTSSNTTLTFYYDNLRRSREGTTYDTDMTINGPRWTNYMGGPSRSVTCVVFDPTFANVSPTSTERWFYEMYNLRSIVNLNYLNTAQVTDMREMFRECRLLTSLDLSNFNTTNVTDMYSMFNGSYWLSSLDLSNFNTANVTNMSSMFSGCSGLTSLNLSSFNTANVTDMNYMFYGCKDLTSLDVSNFDTHNVVNMNSMFKGCENLVTIYAGSEWTSAAVTNTSYTFTSCFELVGGQGTTYDSNHDSAIYARIDGGPSNPGYFTDINAITEPEAYACYTPSNTTLTFYYDTQRNTRTGTTYDLNTGSNKPVWYTDSTCRSVTKVVFNSSFADARPTITYYWFREMGNLTTITGIEYLNTSEVTDMRFMFSHCSNLTSLDVSHFNTSNVTTMYGMFYNCTGLTSLDVNNFNTAQVTNMYIMFSNCSNLTSLDLSHFNTANVTSIGSMFRNCSGLTSLDVSSFNTANVTSMSSMFEGCSGLTSLNLSSFNVANVTSMSSMFEGCSGLTSLNLSSFNTVNMKNMDSMFEGCSGLTSLDVSSFNTANVTSMSSLFEGCSGLTTLDLSSYNTEKVTNMRNMFYNCINMTTIYVGDSWSTAAVSSSNDMFRYCTKLVGGMGTTYDANHVTRAYAHIDGGPSDPGYFTDINATADPEAYACYTPSNTTLTFYYDNQRSTREGMTYNLNEGDNPPGWIGLSYENEYITHVVFDPSFADARPTSTYSWFLNMTKLETITGMEYLNTTAVTNMFMMFNGCNKLSSLDVSHFNTSKVTNMVGMFMDCSTLTSLDVTNFDTYKVTSDYGMYAMFRNCSGLTSLDLSSFNTTRVKNMREMFMGCNNLVTIYAGDNWSIAAVTNSTDMFIGCTSLVGGQGTTFDANHVDAAYAHIDGGPSNPGYFTAEGAQPWTAPEAYACYTPSNTTLTFYYDNQRSTRTGTTYDLDTGSDQPGWYTDGSYSSVTRAVFDPSFADARPTSTRNWFYNMRILESISGLGYLNTSEVTTMDYMFTFCSALTSLDVSNFNTANVTTMCSMFNGCIALISLDVSNFNTANVTTMANLFESCKGLTTLDLGNWNTAKVTNPSWMFSNCTNLKTIYVGNEWSTDAVTFSNGMFSYCSSLVGGAGTVYSESNPKDKTYAHIDGGPSNPGYFTAAGAQPWTGPEAYACYTPSNTTLTFYYDSQRASRTGTTYDLNEGMNDPGWDTDNSYKSVTRVVFDPSFADARPTSMCSWFWGMTNLQSIDGMDCVNTEEVTTMWGMFTSCSGLTVLDLSGFNTSKVTNMLGMFGDCSNLTTIYAGEGWSMAAVSVSSNMFSNCTKLVGGKGTAYDPGHTNGYYARIDGGPSYPGYFTEKVDFVRGDVNGDNQVSIGDVTTLIDYLLSGDASGINLAAADCNQDEGVSIGDVTTLIDYLLSGSW